MIDSLLTEGELIIVGSTLWKKEPRDLDMVLVISDQKFKHIFDMDWDVYVYQCDTGNWDKRKLLHNEYVLYYREKIEDRINATLWDHDNEVPIIGASHYVDLRILSRTLYNYYNRLYTSSKVNQGERIYGSESSQDKK